MTIPLAESELQEISAAYDNAQQKLTAAAEAMEELLSVLRKKAAFISKGRISHLGNFTIPINAPMFELRIQRYKMLKYGAKRAFK